MFDDRLIKQCRKCKLRKGIFRVYCQYEERVIDRRELNSDIDCAAQDRK